jgi:hypothetical protein
MEAVDSSSTVQTYHTKTHHLVGDSILHGHCCEKLKSYNGEDMIVGDREFRTPKPHVTLYRHVMIKIPDRAITHTEIKVCNTFCTENIILKLRIMAHIIHTQKESCEMQI